MSEEEPTAKIKDLARDLVEPSNQSQLTTDHGVKVPDTDNWLKAAPDDGTGPSLLEDQVAREKIHRFDHERIPERVVHARGAGAHGFFQVYDNSAAQWTKAPVLTDPSLKTSVFVRFSTVQGSRGSADTVRDVRGFAIKFYTNEGNWDLVGNSIPVFFIQDAIKFPDVIHAVKAEPHNEVPQGQSAHNNFWDFVGLQTEASHMVMWVMSDRGIPRSYRMMQGFGVNTYTLINAGGKRVFVKFHLMPNLGVHNLMWDEAMKIGGQDPDFHRKDLEEAINRKVFPSWEFGIQVIDPEDKNIDLDSLDFDILDATKTWPESLAKINWIGKLTLNKNVEEYFSEVEQIAFCTGHIVPGIGFSDDPLLQGRNFSYFDTQITRLGINWERIPINRPICPALNFNRDGAGQHRIHKTTINYFPNRDNIINPVPPKDGGYDEYPQKVSGNKQRNRGAKFKEHFNQACSLYASYLPHEKNHLIEAISFELSHCNDDRVYSRYITVLQKIDPKLAECVAANVNAPPQKPKDDSDIGTVQPSEPQISKITLASAEPTIATRRIAVLIANGFDRAEVEAIVQKLTAKNAFPSYVGPVRNVIYAKGEPVGTGKGVVADHHFEGQRSTLFDAIYIPSGPEHIKILSENGRLIHWIREAFGHCKPIAAIGDAVKLVETALNVGPEVKFATDLGSDTVISSYGIVTAGRLRDSCGAPDPTVFGDTFIDAVSKHRFYERELSKLTNKVAY